MQVFKYCDFMIHQIWWIREKKVDGMPSRPEATVLKDIILCRQVDSCD